MVSNDVGEIRIGCIYDQALDTGADFSSFSTSNSSIGFALARPVSLALLHILQSLPEPLIPDHKAPACAAVRDRDEAFGCLEGMSGVDTNASLSPFG